MGDLEVTSAALPGDGPLVLVHGGAWDIPDHVLDAHERGLMRGLRIGERALSRGQSALDIAVEVAAALEDDGTFDAGRGSVLDLDGLPQLDAGLMEGSSMRWGAVANVRSLPNPIRAARAVLEDERQARLLVGEGAERFAAESGLPAVATRAMISDREQERYERLLAYRASHPEHAASAQMDVPKGTVGCVVVDLEGGLASATSTGGAPLTQPGRVGDSPIVGSGFYADGFAAASATGWGEAIATVQLCARAVRRVEDGLEVEKAASKGLLELAERVPWASVVPTAGLLLADAAGRATWAYSTPRMARAFWRPGLDPYVGV
ncbi:isoaspartyl peptidase/L-asparaginase family protein [Rubrivirga sp.]|uniref:isoaspartyl peptidase/L-asparaginase family protein n=1 Tax=Rubrivirga sp. TaxID=1885344 RepID=UPI003C76FACB